MLILPVQRRVLRHNGAASRRSVWLPLDLFSSPLGSINGPRRIFAIRSRFFDESSHPVLPELVRKFTVGKGIGEVPIIKTLRRMSGPKFVVDLPNHSHG